MRSQLGVGIVGRLCLRTALPRASVCNAVYVGLSSREEQAFANAGGRVWCMANNLEKLEEPSVTNDAAGPVISGLNMAEVGKKVNAAAGRIPSPHSQHGPASPKTECRALAQQLALQPATRSRMDQWGLLTAVSEKARRRHQGSHIMLHNSDHMLGRTVAEVSCQFESPAVSGRHCTISRKLVASDGNIKPPGSEAAPGDQYTVFVKDSSSNGTYINHQRLRKNGPELRLQHGDILSLLAMSENENAFAFVYREVIDDPTRQASKRKTSADVDSEAVAGDWKRTRGITSSAEGPVSLDDVRRLQRSNEELRQQIEEHVLNIEKIRGELRAAETRHQVEVKEVKTSVASQYVQEIEEVRQELSKKGSELEESKANCAQQQSTIEDLNQRIAAAGQSRVDAEEAIRSHKCSIAELEKRLEEERDQQEKERLQAEVNLKAAVERTRAEALEEQKRQAEISLRLQKQQQDMITDLQEADKENRRLAENLRSKLEAERELVVNAEEKVRRLEALLQEEKFAKDSARKKGEELQDEIRRVNIELESEKAERESAKAKISSLELEMESAIRDLTLEKQRLQGARERIVLRETQLRAFHSTAAQIEALQQKQQEQLKSMLRTLEDNDEEDSKPKKTRTELEDTDSDNEDKVESTGGNVRSGRDQSSPGLDSKPDKELNPRDSRSSRERDERDEETPAGVGGDWMVGDTQGEEEDYLAALNRPLKAGNLITGTVAGVRDSRVTPQDDSGIKVNNSIMENTQTFDNGQLDITQVLESVQEVGNSEGVQVLIRETRTKFSNDGRRSVDMDEAVGSGSRDDDIVKILLNRDSSSGKGSAQAENDDGGVTGGETMQIDDPVGTVVADTEADMDHVLEGTLRLHPSTNRSVGWSKDENFPNQLTDSDPTARGLREGLNLNNSQDHDGGHDGGTERSGVRVNYAVERMEYTICTDDLLASEVAGSWAVSHGTPASVHGDNESSDSDERDEYAAEGQQHGNEEGASQAAASTGQGRRFRPNYRHVRLEEMLQLADPINSQNSLSPSTTNANRKDGILLDDLLKHATSEEPRLRSSQSPSRPVKNVSDTDDDSPMDGDNERKDVDNSSDDELEP
ncbi:hypothetical protein R1flu_014733 [Riccia fluitans]|uniref:FHA domain-containing protein n=1 Tax=Riccia fluitans TaxID=41844 RepID=A0ABD1YH32_9MARC